MTRIMRKKYKTFKNEHNYYNISINFILELYKIYVKLRFISVIRVLINFVVYREIYFLIQFYRLQQ